MRNQWTPELDRAFAAAWESGVTLDLLKLRFNIGQSSVDLIRRRLGLESRNPDRLWHPNDEEQARALWLLGKSATEIAKALPGNRTRNSIIGRLHRMGLTRNSRPASAPALQTGRAKTRVIKAPKPLPVGHKPRKSTPVGAAERSWQTPVSTPQIQKAQRAYGQSAVEFVEAGAGVESPNALPFLEAIGGCKWPIGQAGATLYCCNPLAGGSGVGRAYCAGHAAVAVDAKQPYSARRDAAPYLTRFDRIEPVRPVPANNNASIWDEGRRVA